MANVLEKICADKREEVAQQKVDFPLEQFKDTLTVSDRSLYNAIKNASTGFILECKRASPSKGLIREQFDLDEMINAYLPYASGISVLTDKKYFQGEHKYLEYVRANVHQPCICKDFFVDPYQVYLARYHNADAILLMLSVLSDEEYQTLAALAGEYQLDILTEVSNQQELERAIALNAKIIGINNRDLRDLSTNLQTTRELAPQIPDDRLIISESGIYTHDHVAELCNYADGFLVGSSLMAQTDLPLAVKKLIVGENKVCGLTRPQDAKAAFDAGAIYGGLIFAEKSPRFVTVEQAQAVQQGAPLDYVGVFVNAPVLTIADTVKALNLAVVQLHGDEDQAYIDKLKPKLPANVKIWKAHNPTLSALPDLSKIDRWLLDSSTKQAAGGTGQTFDWQSIQALKLEIPFMLAGGLTPDNAQQAARQGAIGLDLNSGVEDQPGIKSANKLTAAFNALKQY
ncbi:bifunctional indole-3-glycerol-phosphate synthase TrpC/phosphoribosylanthranilate isomerase TrpF [Catenovulum sp. 2E275]|uniref:bifunctional indole-3-glycerol-phosphate synthase TrpC/phosphoribosylanthranilate isomerase TrpF n=1 Tax=Catenovulum sp. 2E275 TaxID=2980497 RepID=UPI0021D046DC|nr:bifunctional indole-3-glycerol-phosphate synthase TrpC/phosphoribosylanthranilate isomerase TrpF [Catenovulum sp. 2E275]MCU4674794.1 bifunctional indole-3-glycerol-phosphate synthase TrpC/phosphoribosylanthranilate isomerase TrpF [Catenovulum sp. 2E275]